MKPNTALLTAEEMEKGVDGKGCENLPKLYIPAFLPKTIRGAMKATGGNVALAAELLSTSVSRLDTAIRFHKLYQEFKQYEPEKRYLTMAAKQVAEEMEVKRVLFRYEALQSLHQLATMPLSDNSAQLQVKLLAATRLYSETGDASIGSEVDQTLRRLNEDYHQAAPRIKSIRERIVEFEDQPTAAPRVIDVLPEDDPIPVADRAGR